MLVVVNTLHLNQLGGVNKAMNDKKKTMASGTAETKPAVVVIVDDIDKPEEVAAEAPATVPETGKKAKEEKRNGKTKDKKGKKGKEK
jgi:hypothetical protein